MGFLKSLVDIGAKVASVAIPALTGNWPAAAANLASALGGKDGGGMGPLGQIFSALGLDLGKFLPSGLQAAARSLAGNFKGLDDSLLSIFGQKA